MVAGAVHLENSDIVVLEHRRVERLIVDLHIFQRS